MTAESPEMERRTSFVRRLRQGSAAPRRVFSLANEGEPPPRLRETETKKNESSHCNNCSGSIIPTLEQIMLICVSMWLGSELQCHGNGPQ